MFGIAGTAELSTFCPGTGTWNRLQDGNVAQLWVEPLFAAWVLGTTATCLVVTKGAAIHSVCVVHCGVYKGRCHKLLTVGKTAKGL